jgi:hypothetical protein
MFHSDVVTNANVFSTEAMVFDDGSVTWFQSNGVAAKSPHQMVPVTDSPLATLISRLSQVMGVDTAQMARIFISATHSCCDLGGFLPSEFSVIRDFSSGWHGAIRTILRGESSTRLVCTCFNRNTGNEFVWVHDCVRVFNKVI